MQIKSISISHHNIIFTFDDNSSIISEILDAANHQITNFKIQHNTLYINNEPVKFSQKDIPNFIFPGKTLFASAVYNPKVSIDFVFMSFIGNSDISNITSQGSSVDITLTNGVKISGDTDEVYVFTKNSNNEYSVNNNLLNGDSMYIDNISSIKDTSIILDENILRVNYGNLTIKIDSDTHGSEHHHHNDHHKMTNTKIALLVAFLIFKILLVAIPTLFVHYAVKEFYFTVGIGISLFIIVFLFNLKLKHHRHHR